MDLPGARRRPAVLAGLAARRGDRRTAGVAASGAVRDRLGGVGGHARDGRPARAAAARDVRRVRRPVHPGRAGPALAAAADAGRLAVRVVAAGDSLLAPAVTRRLVADLVRRRRARTAEEAAPRRLDALTAREVEILRMPARGLTNAEIATTLFVSEHTVKTHVSNVLGKLGLRDRVQAVICAYEAGLVTPGS
ncbi:LuxR C-terminal-related transcriptional regulator [Streptomyces griseosporeus]|uniref:helix-turn-helix transcriptional regulator n=1 Tax=Streptomyces griseosporeus TaxID=1910 RepID=UPI0036F69F0A